MRVVAIIPARLASTRFPRKVLHPFHGLAMIEHVRRRALLVDGLDDVLVATCDQEIADLVEGSGGKVVMTSTAHLNGTSRAAEVSANLDCSHVLLLQGDEPLLLPRHVEAMLSAIKGNPDGDAWNATAPILEADELDRHSFVKCSIGYDDRILYGFRRSPSVAPFEDQVNYIRKVLGIIAFRREVLAELAEAPVSIVERYESIEQMRVLDARRTLYSVAVEESLPSVNEPYEAEEVLEYIRSAPEQKQLLDRILG
ncbi:MAG: 3-deoxy-manno-octulosonate cytidylyltransferase [Verrucomicrobiaceae bacterium]|nr:MAG: 3-deoxy-manno-octulosonate cytidylyltransferase [Verrucomicrobiaceae bacterium]